MSLLSQQALDDISDEVYDAIGYSLDVRTLLLSTVNRQLRNLLPGVAQSDKLLMDIHLVELNRRIKLSDGTVPLAAWLERAERLVKPFPNALALVQKALAFISGKSFRSDPVRNANAPTPVVIGKIEKERIVISNDMVSYSFLQAGARAGLSVGRMIVQRYNNGNPALLPDGTPVLYLGTGWLIASSLVITNHHVINARDDNEADASVADFDLQGRNALIQFDFHSEEAAGSRYDSVRVEAFDPTLDFAILRLATSPGRDALKLFPEQIQVSPNRPQVVNIIQHPQGLSKKVALRNNHIYDSAYPRVTYFTDTDSGTSGSPVYDDGWKVVALHRASVLVDNVTYMGQTTAWVNEGIQIKAIMDHLRAHHPALADEITSP